MKKRVKRTFFIHHWCGLIAGIFILAISLSGIVLLFDDEVDRKVYSEYFVLDVPARALHIDNSIHWIRTQYSDWDIRIPALPEKKNDALLYELRKGQLRKWLFVHPETGKQIALLDQAHNRITYVALNIHYNLLAGTTGKLVVLLVGTVFLALTITGLILYRRSFWKVLSFRQRISFYSRRQFFSSLHRITGVWALAFNLLMCATGLALAISVVNAAFKPSVK
ncbi:MAG TPA: PepSY-associated TM helix domain-containing protein, partial [Chryseosolibacter sp.]|nr:PepSY-associated TM helix domain-containing protein [Chryseosolibacter sp.]